MSLGDMDVYNDNNASRICYVDVGEEAVKMEREIIYKRVKTIKELREFVREYLIEHSEQRAKAFYAGRNEIYFYEQGWVDALKTIKDLTSKEGLLLYRYVATEEEERVEDKNRDTF
ncbi:MAG: hypothetical protein J7J91_11875 [Deltaproteobacteria bacterium]|nr:hypothetical protein [Deltaproteobacteria bacterium]